MFTFDDSTGTVYQPRPDFVLQDVACHSDDVEKVEAAGDFAGPPVALQSSGSSTGATLLPAS